MLKRGLPLASGASRNASGMETIGRQRDAVVDPGTVTARVLADAKRVFGELADDALIERCTRQAVDDLWREPVRITTYIPVLALRGVRERIEAQRASASRGGEAV